MFPRFKGSSLSPLYKEASAMGQAAELVPLLPTVTADNLIDLLHLAINVNPAVQPTAQVLWEHDKEKVRLINYVVAEDTPPQTRQRLQAKAQSAVMELLEACMLTDNEAMAIEVVGVGAAATLGKAARRGR
jgi:hypothetical protein